MIMIIPGAAKAVGRIGADAAGGAEDGALMPCHDCRNRVVRSAATADRG